MVAGGFYDGDKAIVEPLGDTLVMFQDYTDERCEKLARTLNALAAGLQELRGYATNPSHHSTHC